jgi:type I restriction enzyme S subunit
MDTELNAKQRIDIENHLETLKQSILNKAFHGEIGTNNTYEENALESLKEMLQ